MVCKSSVNCPWQINVVVVHADKVVAYLPASSGMLQKISCKQSIDRVCSLVIKYCKSERLLLSQISHELHQYNHTIFFFRMRNNFAYQRGLMLKSDHRIVIRMALQKNILNSIHDGHQGIAKCRACSRSVWWPGLSRKIESYAKYCSLWVQHRAI